MSEEDCKYYGGNLWEAPSKIRCMVVSTPEGMILISDPSNQGSMVNVRNGNWLYSLEGLKERLSSWKWVGTHIDYIEELCKESMDASCASSDAETRVELATESIEPIEPPTIALERRMRNIARTVFAEEIKRTWIKVIKDAPNFLQIDLEYPKKE